DYNSRKNIPLKVDSSNIRVIPSKELQLTNGESTIEFDVANTHPNEFSSVSIKPEAEGITFYPAEYFIGPMNPDELFTIEFNAVEDDSWSTSKEEEINMSLTANYNNGINRHANTVGDLKFINTSESSESSSKAVLAGGLIIISVPAAFLFYRRRKQ
ncbi:MAG TPA: hypothetical protein VN414_04330, partial [Methanosarcina sp.]|nr:hypothetical protein [Methanosarcina sp.]